GRRRAGLIDRISRLILPPGTCSPRSSYALRTATTILAITSTRFTAAWATIRGTSTGGVTGTRSSPITVGTIATIPAGSTGFTMISGHIVTGLFHDHRTPWRNSRPSFRQRVGAEEPTIHSIRW